MIVIRIDRLPQIRAEHNSTSGLWDVWTPGVFIASDLPEEVAVILAAAPALIEFAYRLSRRPNAPTAIPTKDLLSKLGIELFYPDEAGDPRDIRTRKDK